MATFLDSRIIAGLVSILAIPFAFAGMRYGSTFEQMYADLDSELPTLSQLLLSSGWTNAATVLAAVGAIATLVRIGPERASTASVRVLQAAIVATFVATYVALRAVAEPIEVLFDKIT
jgi:hypothetical protein